MKRLFHAVALSSAAAQRNGSMHARNRSPSASAVAGSLVALLLLLLPVDGAAQFGRSTKSMVKLSQSDIAIMRKIVREDFTDKPKGTSVPWQNPESGNSGTVTLLDRFPSKGRDCRRVRYLIKPGPSQPASVLPGDYVLTSCRLADGTWKIDSAAKPDAH
jgi:surface antigen